MKVNIKILLCFTLSFLMLISSLAIASNGENSSKENLKTIDKSDESISQSCSIDESIEKVIHEYLSLIYDYSIVPLYESFEAMFSAERDDEINFSYEKSKLKRDLMDYYDINVIQQAISYSNYQSIYQDDMKASVTITITNEVETSKESYISKNDYHFLLENTGDDVKINSVISDDDVDKSYKSLSSFLADDVIDILKEDDLTRGRASLEEFNKEKYYLQKEESYIASSYIPYDKSRAASYAKKYAGSNYNKRFASYKGHGGDCQNFASQCVWYGYGGTDTASAINNKLRPMVTGTSNRNWFATSGYMDCSISWIRCTAFKDYINNSYGGNPGPAGWTHVGSVAFAEPGDVIQVNWTGGNQWHSYIVTAVTGTSGARTKSNITVVAHTGDITPRLLSTANSESVSRHTTIRIGTYQP